MSGVVYIHISELERREWETLGDDKAEWSINRGKLHAMEMTRLAKQN